jgi:selenide,water dikinase
LFLTKPIGVGILTTAQKKEKLKAEHATLARDSMVRLNKIGEALARLPYVQAMTDVTGFGLLGHLVEMCEASKVEAHVELEKVPLIDPEAIPYYLAEKCVPGGTHRNWASYGHHIHLTDESQKLILCDPQTSGGLLVAISPDSVTDFQEFARREGFSPEPIGEIRERKGEKLVYVQ